MEVKENRISPDRHLSAVGSCNSGSGSSRGRPEGGDAHQEARYENIHYCDQSANFWVSRTDRLQEKLDYLKQHRLNLLYERKSK